MIPSFSLLRHRLASSSLTQRQLQHLSNRFYYSTAAMDRVHRVTMFKMPKAEDQQLMLEKYRAMDRDNKKDGKRYILSMVVGPAEEDARSQGYTLVSKTEFANLEDMRFYDEECQAHQQVKNLVPTLDCQGILTVYFKPQATGGVTA